MTARLRALSKDQVVAVRYVATHDLVHVFFDEDTDFAGEAAVYGFACGQRYKRHALVCSRARCGHS